MSLGIVILCCIAGIIVIGLISGLVFWLCWYIKGDLEVPYECDICIYKTISYNKGNEHSKSKEHFEKLKKQKAKTIYKCNNCFFKTDDYTRHMIHEHICNNDSWDGMKRP